MFGCCCVGVQLVVRFGWHVIVLLLLRCMSSLCYLPLYVDVMFGGVFGCFVCVGVVLFVVCLCRFDGLLHYCLLFALVVCWCCVLLCLLVVWCWCSSVVL